MLQFSSRVFWRLFAGTFRKKTIAKTKTVNYKRRCTAIEVSGGRGNRGIVEENSQWAISPAASYHDLSRQEGDYDLQTRTRSTAMLTPVPLKERLMVISWPTAAEPLAILRFADTSVKVLKGSVETITTSELRTLPCMSSNSRERNDEPPVELVRDTDAPSVYVVSASYTAGSTWEITPVDVGATRTLLPCLASVRLPVKAFVGLTMRIDPPGGMAIGRG